MSLDLHAYAGVDEKTLINSRTTELDTTELDVVFPIREVDLPCVNKTY